LSRALKATDLHYAYGGRGAAEAVAGVTLAVERGEFVSLIGPNGSGKTTLLRLLSGALRPDEGRVEIFERDAARMSRREIARTVAVVPQDTTVTFAFTVEDVVLMGRFPHLGAYGFEGEHDFAVAREALTATDTLGFASRYIQDLSGGERQRVIVARALAQEADILLLDEPTAFLDIRHQVEISRLVRRLQGEKNLTVVAASHDLNLAAAFSDRLVLLKDGKVFADGTPAEVMRADVLEAAYETDVYVGNWEEGPFVVPRTRREEGRK
jgi:iron complex transport system ATP-binding protein